MRPVLRWKQDACQGAWKDSGQDSGQGGRPVCQRAVRMVGLFVAAGVALAGLMNPVAAQEVKGDAKAAEQKISMCIGCHAIGGYKSSFPAVYHVPKIYGQTGKYIENALNAYRSGDRSHPTMQAIAGSLSDQDIADLAAYYGRTPGAK